MARLPGSPPRHLTYNHQASICFIIVIPRYSRVIHKDLDLTIQRAHETLQYVPTSYRANATMLMLCRNKEIEGVVSTIRQIEDRFNYKYAYPWVLLNDEPFSDDFKARVSVLTDAPIHFGYIPPAIWNQPEWINETRAEQGRQHLLDLDVIYGGSVPFNSGFFYRHPLVQPYRYYWRPNVDYFCDLSYDPFTYMEVSKKVYGFTLSLPEYEETVKSLWPTVKEFINEYPQYLHPDNALAWLSADGGDTYNMCHFWSNFEIADMDFWRGEAYTKFFDYLEMKGGFYYERWGDAPVHSIAVALFAPKDSIHYFYDIGYRHEDFYHCPGDSTWATGRCSCLKGTSFNGRPAACTNSLVKIASSLY
ncbi:glycosyl transferase [Coprinopsis marcescibilis]|uniref:Glycosyl transferase n=1 Tax=Coprinopsis marcescibilis TaxID=230819 RepID=A0A5C3KJI9_COPMA|nr:glycosyl transferase [Coprinopsis marcescibilis]